MPKPSHLEGIRFYPIESADTEERAFHSGFLHLTQTVSPDRIDFLKENHPDLIHFESYLGTYFYRFNVEEPPLMMYGSASLLIWQRIGKPSLKR